MQRLKFLIAILFMASSTLSFAKSGGEASLEKTYWKLADVNGNALSTSSNGREAYIMLISKKSRVEGNTGCNSLAGKYEMGRHGYIKFTVAGTKMACGNMETENYMQNALSNANRYVINGQNLLLYNDNLLLAIFEAREDQNTDDKKK